LKTVKLRGFTIVEVLVVMVVLAILASVAMPVAELTATRRKEEELRRALWAIRDAIDAYKRAVDEGRIIPRPTASGYPVSLEALTASYSNTRDDGAHGQVQRFLRRVPRDPFHPDPTAPAALTWQLRSYASPADRPAPGDDVYDVMSHSSRVSLDGRPYREW
jgi:general secretion pathway protein G